MTCCNATQLTGQRDDPSFKRPPNAVHAHTIHTWPHHHAVHHAQISPLFTGRNPVPATKKGKMVLDKGIVRPQSGVILNKSIQVHYNTPGQIRKKASHVGHAG